ncbi:hypothetical protein BDQ17DRAFT_1328823 [Cyathus striatus]|nr:hypothetical protein BDQ17DRAFT_1328823 [Cyathus striatus]
MHFDTAQRNGQEANSPQAQRSILGFDCAGVVSSLGSQASPNTFSAGGKTWLLGSTVPTHSNGEYVAVDYRNIAPKLKPLSFEDVAAVPLTGAGSEPGALLVINGAGGVGSAGIQLAKAKGVKNIIVTASWDVRRGADEGISIKHVKAVGATHTVNHRERLKHQIEAFNFGELIKYIRYSKSLQRPKKGVSLHCGFVFTRMALKWEMEYQRKALKDMARLFVEGKLKIIMTKTLELTVQGVRDAHTFMEAIETIGKVVLKVPEEGFVSENCDVFELTYPIPCATKCPIGPMGGGETVQLYQRST